MMISKWIRALISVVLVTISVSLIHAADITPYAYVELSKQSMEQKAQDLNQLIGAITTYTAEPDIWLAEEAQMTEVFDSRLGTLYDSYGVTTEQFLLYYSHYKDDVESYLDVHTDDRQIIDQLGAEVTALLNQYEQLKVDLLQLTVPAGDDPLPEDAP